MVAVLNLPVSVGVKVAVIVAEPAFPTVTAPDDALTLATEVFDDPYDTEPATDPLSKLAVGAVGVNVAVIVAEPAPATVATEPEMLRTEVFDDA